MQSGYAITIRAFIPIDPKNIETHANALEAIRGAQADKAFDDLMTIAKIEEFTVKPVQRREKEAAT